MAAVDLSAPISSSCSLSQGALSDPLAGLLSCLPPVATATHGSVGAGVGSCQQLPPAATQEAPPLRGLDRALGHLTGLTALKELHLEGKVGALTRWRGRSDLWKRVCGSEGPAKW